tara:strand:- start:685 stop:834 length:150 start_codon:yes stop_codon:yes gene_type:complete
MDDNVKDAIKIIIFTIIVLGSIVLMACDGGWKIGGLNIPEQSLETPQES